MNRDLFLAVLAMDSYNQGYGVGETVDNATLGTATRIETTQANTTEFSIGFSATSYTWGGETIIAYRGTDSKFGSSISDLR